MLRENFISDAWLRVYRFCNGDELVLNVCAPFLIMTTLYWTVGCVFTLADVRAAPRFVTRHKIDDDVQFPRVTLSRLYGVLSQVLFNQTIVALPVIYLSFVVRCWIGYDNRPHLPTIERFLMDYVMFILTEEAFFYYSHRLLHAPALYHRFHKRHHEWRSPIAVSAIYCHPVEHVLSNVLPTWLGPVLTGAHTSSLWMWVAFTTFYGVVVHSGYHLPLTPSPQAHHFHHLRFNENYGIIGLLDWLHGTDTEFRKSKYYQRNKVLFP